MRKASSRRKKSIIIALTAVVAVLLIGGGVFAYQRLSQSSTESVKDTSTNSPDTPTNNQDSPSVDKAHDKGSQENPSNNSPQSTTNSEIVIVDASQYDSVFEVRAYANAFEDGVCTFTFTKDSNSFAKTSKATTGPSTTSCATLDVAIGDFSQKGDWNLSVSYQSTSKSYSGKTSRTIRIE